MNRRKNRLSDHIDPMFIDAISKFSADKNSGKKKVMVYVEGYDDIAFWRNVLCDFESDKLTFEINVPTRGDLAKGKKVLLSMAQNVGNSLVLCMDSDFDYLFQGATEQSKIMLSSPYILHTYTYAIENHLCYAPSLRQVCVKATKNDALLFDFEKFIADYSKVVYPLFLWYAFSAMSDNQKFFVLADFRNSVRIGFLDIRNNGASTIEWLRRSAEKRVRLLEAKNVQWVERVEQFGKRLEFLGVSPENCYQFMQGHTLYENVSLVVQTICELLTTSKLQEIKNSSRRGVSLVNEISYYKNSQRSADSVLHDNDNYKEARLYKLMVSDVKRMVNKIIYPDGAATNRHPYKKE